MHQEAKKVFPGGDTRNVTFFKPYPSFMDHGKGCRIWDVDGNEIIDFQNNYTSLIHGHAHPSIVAAVQEQIAKGSVYSAPFEKQTELAEIICNRVSSVDKIRFTNSGTEATMHAVRGARAYTGRTKFVKIEGGYHGSSDTFEASVEPDMDKVGDINNPIAVADSKGVPKEIVDQVIIVPFNNIGVTKRLIEENHRDIAAFIIEPIMGSAGMLEPSREYLTFIREITQTYGIVLIFDEVVTFRLTTGGAQQYNGITPDMTAFGKIIGGGIPIGAFGGKEDIMRMYDPTAKMMYHSGTFNGNAISMAAGISAMKDYGEKEVAHVNHLGELFRKECKRVFKEVGIDICVNGVGSLSNIIFSNDRITEYRGIANSH
ncbi:aminotransferase class III-fold pyridoxal phosphate-dependent enzyme, partial [bacterium]|nr:aminotransferase class III-fold pyridoxal phosphate-dependent enzyme [bacterium]